MEIQILRKQGMSLRDIAREMGVSVNTARKYLKQEGPPPSATRVARPTKLDAFKDYLRSRVEAARLNHDTDATGYQVCAQLLENQSMAHVPRVPHPRSTSFVLTWLLAADLLASQ